jgi:hypothetical protein
MGIPLTSGYFLYENPKALPIMKPYPPLGILCICCSLVQGQSDERAGLRGTMTEVQA